MEWLNPMMLKAEYSAIMQTIVVQWRPNFYWLDIKLNYLIY